MNGKRIWVLGSSNLDNTFHVDRLPPAGATTLILEHATALGGKGANVAVVCARQSVPTALIGCVGQDDIGGIMREELKRYGVDTDSLAEADAISSGAAYIMVDPQGANTILVNPGANMHIPLSLHPPFAHGDFLVAQFEINRDALLFYLRQARSAGVQILLNPSPFINDEDCIRQADYLVVNEMELAELSGMSVESEHGILNAARAAVDRYGCKIVATLGGSGALLMDSAGYWHARGYPVQVSDTQGAGDTFLGFFAAALFKEYALPQALLRANIAAALSVTSIGSAQQSFTASEAVERICGDMPKSLDYISF